MNSVADLCNQALGMIGVADEIQDLDNESSKEAQACRRFYVPVRDQVLRDFPWPRLTVTAALTLVQDFTGVDGAEWTYSYRMPASCATIRRLLNGSTRIDTQTTVVAYDFGRDDAGDLVFTDMEDAQAQFTYAETAPERFPADMATAITFLLAALISARFGPEAVKLGDRALKLYEWRRATAQANALNEVQRDITDDSSFLSARG